jgi:signal transduction histidine kinase
VPVIEAVLRQFDSRKQETNLSFQVMAASPCLAYADRTLLTQIIYNLVSNAVKYSPAGSTIRIFAEAGDLDVTVRVKDEGPGISPEYQERIFEKFYRVKDDFVYKHKGHGLGLYLSRFFAEQIGARISVASTPGEGAEFTLALRRQGRT